MVKDRERIPKRDKVSIGRRETKGFNWSRETNCPNWSNKESEFQLVKNIQMVSMIG